MPFIRMKKRVKAAGSEKWRLLDICAMLDEIFGQQTVKANEDLLYARRHTVVCDGLLHDGGHLARVAELTIIADCCFHVGGIYKKEVRDLVPLTSESLYIIAVRKFS